MNLTRRTFLRAAGVVAGVAAGSTRSPPRARGRAAAEPPRRMVCICTPLGLHPPYFFPEKAGKDYELDAVPGSRSRTSATTSRSSPGCRIRTSGSSHDSISSFLTARPASGAAGRLPQQHLARPVRGRAHRRPDAVPQPGAVVRGLRPVVDAQRRARAVGHFAVERVRPAVPRRPARRSRRPRRAACATAGASSTPSATRPSSCSRPRRRRPRQARRVLHQRPRAGAAAGPGRGVVEEAQAQGRRQAAAEHHQRGRPDRQDAAAVRPDPPGPADRFDAAGHASCCSARAACRRFRACRLGHHDLSHHGKDPAKIEQLKTVEMEKMKTLRDFLAKLKQTQGGGRQPARPDDGLLQQQPGRRQQPLASRTCRSCSPAAASSTASTWPSIPTNPPPLCNLYVSMLQRLGIEADKFGSQHRDADGAGSGRVSGG